MLVIKYAFFALIATLINLISQWGCLVLYSGYGALLVALGVGTFTGLVVKYYLDKNYIFIHHSDSLKNDSKLFLLYSLAGVITTCIFWVTEIAFDAIFQASQAKYVGGAIGLTLGYWIKYRLDKRFVFIQSKPA